MTPEEFQELKKKFFELHCLVEAIQFDYTEYVAKKEGVYPEDIWERIWKKQLEFIVDNKDKQ